ncbi:hypothetical protein R6Q57_001468 [Mikania cordata]
MDDEVMAGKCDDDLILDDEAVEHVHHQWLQFEPGTASDVRCRRLLRMAVGAHHRIDWGVPANVADLPTYRLITVEFLSTFRYLAHQAAVAEQEEEESLPDIEFHLYGQHFETKITRFSVQIGIYYEPETVTDTFVQGLTQDLHRPVSEPPTLSFDDLGPTYPLHPLVHRYDYIRTRTEPGEHDTLGGGTYVNHIAHSRGMFHLLQDLTAIQPRTLDRRTILNIKLAVDIQGVGLQFIGSDGHIWHSA